MIVQHNMQAMNASRMLGITTGNQSKATEKLSSATELTVRRTMLQDLQFLKK